MAYPRILQRLFANNGAGPLLRADILPSVEKYDIAQYYWFEDEMPRPGLFSCLGGIVQNISRYPKMIEYLQTTHGQKRCVTQAQYDAAHIAVWHTNADGTKVGWNGIGGVNKFVWNQQANTLRLPDLAGMSPEMIGCDSLGVGGVHGDAVRPVSGFFGAVFGVNIPSPPTGGPFTARKDSDEGQTGNNNGSINTTVGFEIDRVHPTAAKVQGRAWGSLACVYLGLAS